jgi:hypothetical protein
MRPTALRIPQPRIERPSSGVTRVTARVDGVELFFESTLPLAARSESLVSAFLLPAMTRGADLEVEGGLAPRFLDNLAFISRRAREWWPRLSPVEVRASASEEPRASEGAGVFYTGGVDSSYALQQLHSRLRYAVFAEGFDVRLDDTQRLARAREWLSRTAGACGVGFGVVRTNLRSHPLFRVLNWEITHGAALASVAHALSGVIGTMYVAATDVAPPWGSSPELDAAWSSDAMRIENFSGEMTRLQRIASIAGWEPLRGRLRVCWENKSSDLNCGFCEKCVRTRLQLHAVGARDEMGSFPPGIDLRSAIRRLEPHSHQLPWWRELAGRLDDPTLRREVELLLAAADPSSWRSRLRRFRRLALRASRWAARRAATLSF